MSIKVNHIKGRELTSDLIVAWRELRQSNPALVNPYFCSEFMQAVASTREDVEIAIFEDAGRVIGFLPYQRGPRGVAGPAGGILSDYQGVICEPGFECNPIDLLKACRLRAWDFDHLLTSQACFERFHLHQELSPQIDVSRGYDAYVAERRAGGSDQIRKCANLMRRIEREVGPLTFVDHAADPSMLNQVLAWKSEQYVASGKRDLFSLGWTRQVVEIIHATQGDDFGGMLSLLFAGDRLVSGHFGMRSRTVWHYWFPSYDKAMARYSPGVILLLKMAEHAPSVGLRTIDLGKGTSLYKERLMNASVTLASGSVELPSLRKLARQSRRNLRKLVKSAPFGSLIQSRLRRSQPA